MSDFEKLKNMDPEEVYKKTFIAPKVVKNLTEGNFKKLGNRAKALGFVAILERELGLDLSELKEKIDEYFGVAGSSEVFAVKEKGGEKKSAPLWIVAILVVAIAIGLYLWTTGGPSQKSEPAEKDFLAVQSSSSAERLVEVNETQSSSSSLQEIQASSSEATSVSEESNLSESNETVLSQEENLSSSSEEATHYPTVTIVPKRKIWVGIIYLDNYKRKNYITSKPIELNTSRDQLIVTGHGLFKVDVDGNITEFNAQGKQRLLYRAGVLEKIDRTTFRQLNRGKDW